MEMDFYESVKTITDMNKRFLDSTMSSLEVPEGNTVSKALFAFNAMFRAAESGGITRAVGATFFV